MRSLVVNGFYLRCQMGPIGFVNFPEDWVGPVTLEFSLYSIHSRVTRYKSQLETRDFDLYAPNFMIDALSPEKTPSTLLAVIGRAPVKKEKIGFTSTTCPPKIESDLCEYLYSEEKVNSFLYYITIKGFGYGLYIPKEIFHGKPPPSAVYLRLGISETEVNPTASEG
jgi:hypothetical protein